MSEEFRVKSAQMMKAFHDSQDKIRADKDLEAKNRQTFLDAFESKVNGAITEHVSDFLSSLGDKSDITIAPKGDPERTWYEVTISATPEDGTKRTCTVRFEADYNSKTISTQRPEATGRYTNINGSVTLGNFQISHVTKALLNCLENVLRD